ncbi:MAG: hypothetical protein ACKO04_09085 [Actinomycetes bacterium]
MADPTKPPRVMLVTGLLLLALGLGSCTFSGRSAQTLQTAIFDDENAGVVVPMGTPRPITATGTVLLVFSSPAGSTCRLTGSDGKVLRPKPAPKVPVEVPDSELTFDTATDVDVVAGVTYAVECAPPKGVDTGRFAVANLPGGSARLSLLGVTGVGGGLLTLVGLGLTVGGLFGRRRWRRSPTTVAAPEMPGSPPPMAPPSAGPPPDHDES